MTRPDAPVAPSRDSPTRLIAVALSVAVLCVASIMLTRATGRVALFWAANALVLRLVIRQPARTAALRLLAAYAGNVAGDLFTGDPWGLAFGLSAANTFEVVLALVIINAVLGSRDFDIATPRSQVAFAAAALIAPLASAPMAADLLGSDVQFRWWATDALGYFVFTPALSVVTADGLRRLQSNRAVEAVIELTALAAAVALSLAFSPSHRLMPVMPFVMLTALRLGAEGAALAAPAMALGGLAGILLHDGTVAVSAPLLVPLLQVGLFVNIVVSLPVGLLVTRTSEHARAAASTLAVEKARYEDLIDRIPVGVYRLRLNASGDSRFEFASPQLERMLKVPPGTLVRDATPAFALAHPEDRDDLIAANRQAAQTLSSFSWEGRFVIDGETRWFRIASEPKPAEGGGALWHGVFTDITWRVRERQALESAQVAIERETVRYRSILAIAHDGIHVVDPDGRLIEANAAFLRSIGRTPDDVPHLRVEDWDAQLTPDEIRQAIARLMDTPATFETRHRRADGTTFDAEVNAGAVTLDGQRYLLAASRDISHRKEAERQQRQLMTELERRVADGVARAVASERALIHQSRLAAMGEMIGNIAHQWRQPLNTLGMTLANLRDSYDDGRMTAETLHETVAHAGRLLRQMSNTISDFSEFFRPDKEAVAFSLRAQVEEALDLVAASFRHHGITVDIEGGDGLTSHGFPNEYAQVVLNLLSNARDAVMTRGPGERRVSIALTSEGPWCHVTVGDNGGGVTLDPPERAFEPYVTTKTGGTGLGLYMSKMIVERSLGGELTVRNGPEGAAFTITTRIGGR